jgi:hypothetical protein
MTTAVVTLQFGPEREYFAIGRAALRKFCALHGYELRVSPGINYPDGRDGRWAKVDALWSALRDHELALYLDADSLPVNPKRPVSDLEPYMMAADLLVGEDTRGHANTGVMLVRRAALDILEHWASVPNQHPETARTWPVDELGFNLYTLPAFRDRIAFPPRLARPETDFLRGSWVHHFCNGTSAGKAVALRRLVTDWPLDVYLGGES